LLPACLVLGLQNFLERPLANRPCAICTAGVLQRPRTCCESQTSRWERLPVLSAMNPRRHSVERSRRCSERRRAKREVTRTRSPGTGLPRFVARRRDPICGPAARFGAYITIEGQILGGATHRGMPARTRSNRGQLGQTGSPPSGSPKLPRYSRYGREAAEDWSRSGSDSSQIKCLRRAADNAAANCGLN
jgi:hypothetical protein